MQRRHSSAGRGRCVRVRRCGCTWRWQLTADSEWGRAQESEKRESGASAGVEARWAAEYPARLIRVDLLLEEGRFLRPPHLLLGDLLAHGFDLGDRRQVVPALLVLLGDLGVAAHLPRRYRARRV